MMLKNAKPCTATTSFNCNGGGNKTKLPRWILLFKEGLGEIEKEGNFLVDRQSYMLLTRYIARRGVDIVFDYEHQSISKGKAPAAGWIIDYRYTNGLGIEVKVNWTEEAAGFIAKGEYRYFSPVFYTRKTDKRIIGMHSVALTNVPKTNKLSPLLAKLETNCKDVMQGGNSTMAKKKDFDALVARLTTRNAQDAVESALRTGKLTLNQKNWAFEYAKQDIDGFDLFISKAPKVAIPTVDQAVIKQTVEGAVAMGSIFGNSEGDIRKYGV